jgi:hypothetical protein
VRRFLALAILLLSALSANAQEWDTITNSWHKVATPGGIGAAVCTPPLACAAGAFSIDTASFSSLVQAPSLRGYDLSVSRQLVRTGAMVVAWIGDSWSAGWTQPLRARLVQQYGFGGDGYYPLSNVGSGGHWTLYAAAISTGGVGSLARTGTWVDSNLPGVGDSFNLTEAHSTDTTATATVVSRVTTFVVHYKVQTGGGSFTWAVDGGGATTVDTSAGTPGTFVTVSTTPVTLGTHTVVIRVTVAGAAGVNFAGIDMQAGTTGVRVQETGVGGTTTTHWTTPNATAWESDLSLLVPDVVFVSLGGINDKTLNVTPATYLANLTTLRARIKAAVPNADVVFLSQAENAVSATYTIAQYLPQERSVAVANSDGWVDNYALFGDNTTATSMGLWLDTLHPSLSGNLALQRRLSAFMGDDSASYGQFAIYPRFHHAYDYDSILFGGTAGAHFLIGDAGFGVGFPFSIYPTLAAYQAGTPSMTFNSNGTTSTLGLGIGGIAVSGAGTILTIAGSVKTDTNGYMINSGLGYSYGAVTSPSTGIIQLGGSNVSIVQTSVATVVTTVATSTETTSIVPYRGTAYEVTLTADAVVQYGQVVMVSSTDGRFTQNTGGATTAIGVLGGNVTLPVATLGPSSAGTAYGVAILGRAYVAPAEDQAVVHGHFLVMSATAGYVNDSATISTIGLNIGKALYSEPVTATINPAGCTGSAGCINTALNTPNTGPAGQITLGTSPNWAVGDPVIYWASGGTAPTGFTTGNVYWIKSIGGANVTIAATKTGSAIVPSSQGTDATQYLARLPQAIINIQ